MHAETRDPHDPSFVPSDREQAEARITAYALGDLDLAERDEVERLLADPTQGDARGQLAEVRRLAELLRTRPEDSPESRSSDLRRAILAKAAGTPAPVSPRPGQTASRRTWRILALVGGLAAAVLVSATVFMERSAYQPLARRTEDLRPRPTLGSPQSPAVMRASEMQDRSEMIPEPAAQMPHVIARGMGRAPAPNGRAAGAASPAFPPETEIASHGEGYASVSESRPLSPREQPLSTFSIDVDTASYANVRRFLTGGRRPPRDAVRIEELVNYFRYDYPQPEGDAPFSVTVDAAECPWKDGHRLVRIGLQGRQIYRGARPAGNLVFLVDVSGSMNAPNKLPLVKQALAMLVEELTENDRVSIVTYAGNAGLVLPPTTGDQKQEILAAIESLTPGGSTHGSAGIALAYEQSQGHFVAGGSNRVILATDGDLNVGVTSTAALIDLIKEKAAGGTFLTVLGFGEGNLQDDKMEALADNGNGVYAYIDGVREARKVLVEQLTGSTVTIAKDVKIQVEFNPAQVASYRLLGYENRALAARDFRDDKKDAGEIGAGHSVTALYEVVLVGDESASHGGAEPLKYQPQPGPQQQVAVDPDASKELLTVKLRWKRPDGDTSTLAEVPLADRGAAFDKAPADLRFTAAVAAFGMILRGSDQMGEATLPLVAKIAGGALGRDESGYRAEFLDLVRRAEAAR
jgi:Ca-activated chloride channel family protein